MIKLLSLCIFICVCICVASIMKYFRGTQRGKTRKRNVHELAIIIACFVLVVTMFHIMNASSKWFNTPEEAWKAVESYNKEDYEPICKIEGSNICVFVERNKEDGFGIDTYISIKQDNKWRQMSGKDKTVEKYSNGLQCTVCYSEDCQGAIVVVSPLESAKKQFQSSVIADSQNSTFSERKIQRTDGTYYYQYETILASIDNNYWIEIDGEKIKPYRSFQL